MATKLSSAEIQTSRQLLHADWSLNDDSDIIRRTFNFDNYYQTMAFANSVAWISHRQNHHSDMLISYKTCRIDFSTHSVGGLSELDFICAQAIDKLVT